MKKLLLFTILLLFASLGFSQENGTNITQPKIEESSYKSSFQGVIFGVRGGYNISNLDFETSPTMRNKHRNSLYFGAFADIGFSGTISLVPELQFSAEGARDEELHLDYIQAPILLKFKLNRRFRLSVGPQAGLKVYKLNDGVKDFALSAVGGLEFKINEMLFLDARYTYGVDNVFNDYTGMEAKNTNIQIGIGYQF